MNKAGVMAGHLVPGTEDFAGEIFILETEMVPALKREYDEANPV